MQDLSAVRRTCNLIIYTNTKIALKGGKLTQGSAALRTQHLSE